MWRRKAGKRELLVKHGLGMTANENNVFGNQNKMPKSQGHGTWEQPSREDYRDKKIQLFLKMPFYTGTSWNSALASVLQTDPSSPQRLSSYGREMNDFYSDG